MNHSIVPWLSVEDGHRAVGYYIGAFGAKVVYRMEDPGGGLVARLSVEGAEFWVSGGPGAVGPDPGSVGNPGGKLLLGGDTVRMVLMTPDPDALFAKALQAGATEVYPVTEAHGWRLGRLCDPFGLHWEIGRLLKAE
ncbi:MAG TPA: hypothetical protein VL547_18805 [Dinghuibacter sp.]|uniref:VOC family protein n=1 Tax=Dinghuibacter sp. TaxID=2024697 RepID=UPI002B638BB0|nr:VOC family protein [Dinghuibacter sp.]HTJ14099.1 hypothetical protein [Dinghuibacter sp.]